MHEENPNADSNKRTSPNWNRWQGRLTAPLIEAVALSLDLEPSEIVTEYMKQEVEIFRQGGRMSENPYLMAFSREYALNDEFTARVNISLDHISVHGFDIVKIGHMYCSVKLNEFVAFAKSLQWNIPDNLVSITTRTDKCTPHDFVFDSTAYVHKRMEDIHTEKTTGKEKASNNNPGRHNKINDETYNMLVAERNDLVEKEGKSLASASKIVMNRHKDINYSPGSLRQAEPKPKKS